MRSYRPIPQQTGTSRRQAIDLTGDDSDDDDAGPTRSTAPTRSNFGEVKVKMEPGYAQPPLRGPGESNGGGRDHSYHQNEGHDSTSDNDHDDYSDIEVLDGSDGEYQDPQGPQLLKDLFTKWPKGDAKRAILHELQSPESERLWSTWLDKYPPGNIDPADHFTPSSGTSIQKPLSTTPTDLTSPPFEKLPLGCSSRLNPKPGDMALGV
ncbi:uncharacterized protein LOC62_06G008754 [Vanrija pseudolonga]|uniref:Uncharacterized protein n=1 Tax=Vanrija pseudolonga TaxID=143232 RepID=A0AAF0YJN7_9TREE|nr:hypothetical protein LOC62_06G008754 [Vanrija pseudolonga]